MCAEDVAGDGEAEAAVIRAGVKERIEEAREIGGREERAGMVYEETRAAVRARFGAKIDGIACRRMIDGVRKNMRESRAGFRLIDEHREFARSGDGEFDVARGR